jgi:hypothetical protein
MKRTICAAVMMLSLTAAGRAQSGLPNFGGTWSIDIATMAR